jgi:hypothetical protein
MAAPVPELMDTPRIGKAHFVKPLSSLRKTLGSAEQHLENTALTVNFKQGPE